MSESLSSVSRANSAYQLVKIVMPLLPLAMTPRLIAASLLLLLLMMGSRGVAAEKYCSYQNNVEPRVADETTDEGAADDDGGVDVTTASNGTLSAEKVDKGVSLVKRRKPGPGPYLGTVLPDNQTMKCEKPGTVFMILNS